MSSVKPFILCGPDDVAIHEGSMVELIFGRLKDQNGETILMVDEIKVTVTSKTLLVKSVVLADVLRKWGVKKGDVISIVSENSLNYFVPVLASLYVGATVSPVNPVYSVGELKRAFEQTHPKIIFCSESIVSTVVGLKKEFGFVEKIISMTGSGGDEAIGLETLLEDVDYDVNGFGVSKNVCDEDIAFILSSSGTTGLPKGVMITFGNLRHSMVYFEAEQYVNINSDVVALAAVPFFHIFGLFVHLFGILAGMKAVILHKFKPEVYLKSIEDNKVTKLFIVPQLALFLSNSPLVEQFNLSSVIDVLCGAAPLSRHTLEDLRQRLKLPVRQLYGMSENGAATIDNLGHPEKTCSVGVLVPTLKAKVCHVETSELLGPNEEGELYFKGPTCMKGYVNNPQATKDAFDEEGYLRTGDVGYYDEDGHFFIVDRLKDLIKYKGFQVPPAELEAILMRHPGVAEAAVIGVPDERAGEVPLAVIVKKTDEDVTEQELINLVAEHVSVLKQLHGGVKFVDGLPKTPTGKIMKKVLRETL